MNQSLLIARSSSALEIDRAVTIAAATRSFDPRQMRARVGANGLAARRARGAAFVPSCLSLGLSLLVLLLIAPLAAYAHCAPVADLTFITHEAKCEAQLIPVARFYDEAKEKYHMKDGSFTSAEAHEGCCVLDKGIALMELLYSIQKCHSYKTHEDARTAHKNEPAALRSPYMPQAQIAPTGSPRASEVASEVRLAVAQPMSVARRPMLV